MGPSRGELRKREQQVRRSERQARQDVGKEDLRASGRHDLVDFAGVQKAQLVGARGPQPGVVDLPQPDCVGKSLAGAVAGVGAGDK